MRRVLRSVVAFIGMLAIYSVFPVPGAKAPGVVEALVFVGGLACLIYAVLTMVRRARDTRDDVGVRVEGLVALLYVVVVFFSLVYVGLASRPNQFADLDNRVDALYFTMSTIATVGYGDVHPVGEAARIIVTIQLGFDLVFLGVVARLVGPAVARRRRERLSDPPPPPP